MTGVERELLEIIKSAATPEAAVAEIFNRMNFVVDRCICGHMKADHEWAIMSCNECQDRRDCTGFLSETEAL